MYAGDSVGFTITDPMTRDLTDIGVTEVSFECFEFPSMSSGVTIAATALQVNGTATIQLGGILTNGNAGKVFADMRLVIVDGDGQTTFPVTIDGKDSVRVGRQVSP